MPHTRIKVVSDACCHIPNANIAGRVTRGHSAYGFLIVDELDQVVSEHGGYLGEMTPPQAEYNGLIAALDEAAKVCRGNVEVWMDSEFIIRQMNGDYGIKSDNMKPLYDQVKVLERRFVKGVVKYFHHPETAPLARRAHQLADIEYRKHRP